MSHPDMMPIDSEPESTPLEVDDLIEIARDEGRDNGYIASLTSFLRGSLDQGGATLEQALQMLDPSSVEAAKERLAEISKKQTETLQANVDRAHWMGSKAINAALGMLNPFRRP